MSVIIPTLNRHKVLVETVNSLCSGTLIPSQIVIIDQSEIPISQTEFHLPSEVELNIIRQEVASSTKARNAGITNSREEIILFCDDDILVNENSLQELYQSINQENIGLVSAIHCADNQVFTDASGNTLRDLIGTGMGMKKFWRNDGYVVKSSLRGRYSRKISQITDTEWAMGYFFCVKRSIINEMDHWFDENLIRYAYAEDLDFTYRYCLEAKKRNLRTVVNPNIYVNHLASREWRVPKQEEVNYMFVNRRYLSYKLFPKRFDYRVFMQIFDRLYLLSQNKNKEYADMIRNALDICSKNPELIKDGHIQEALEDGKS